MNEQLSGRELDKAIALALGYYVKKRRIIAPDGNPVKVATHGIGRFSEDVELREVVGDDDFLWAHAPAFHADANAVIDVCAARGWELRYELDHSEEVTSYVAWVETDEMRPDRYGRLTNEYDGRSAKSWQEAAARALLAALTAEAAQP